MRYRRRIGMAGLALIPALVSALASPGSVLAQPSGPASYCFAPGTPQEVMDAWNQRAKTGPAFYTGSRWSGTLGSPRALTWSFVPDGVTWGDEAKPNALFSKLDAQFASQGGRQKWISLFEACFARWAELSGVSYTRIKQGSSDWDDGASYGTTGGAARGDIRIGMIPLDGQYNILAYNYFPSNGDMILDSGENWADSANNFRFLRNTVMHEHGHGLGLQHVCPTNGTKLMEPMLSTTFDGPQHDDIRAAHALYGDDFEDNNTSAAAKLIGTFGAGSTLSFGDVPSPAVANGSRLSIDANGEEDYFRFTLTAATGLALTLIPVGLSYDSSVQNTDGTCASGNTINSLALADLSIQVTNSSGGVLATAAAQPAGQPETIGSVFLPAAGDYYIRVYEANTPTGPQLYRISLAFIGQDCNGNGVADSTDLANGTSRDCNSNGQPDECETALDSDGDHVPDSCERAHGDFDLDGDVDLADFGLLQRCLGPGPVTDPECSKALLDANADIDAADVAIFMACLSGANRPYDWLCR